MILKKISYHNFRAFIGDQSVNLAPKDDCPEKNVTVILGKNTYGKSTFVLSFVWCLYGISRYDKKESILNTKIANQMSIGSQEKASVEIEFEENGIDYLFKRTQRFVKLDGGKLSSDESQAEMYCFEKGELKNIATTQAQINERINSILPYDLSPFFFFEGEKDNQIDRTDLGDSVRTLLGFEAFDNMRMHLFGSGSTSPSSSSVMGYYLGQMSDHSSSKAQTEHNKYCNAEEELSTINELISKKREQIDKYEKDIEDINEKLRQFEPSKDLQRERDKLSADTAKKKLELDKSTKQLLKKFGADVYNLLFFMMSPKAKERLVNLNYNDKGITGLEVSAIRDLLSRGSCLCGTELKEGTLAYNRVASYIDFLPPKSIGSLVGTVQDNIAGFDEKASRFVEEFNEIYNTIQGCRIAIDENDRQDKALLFQLKQLGNIDTSAMELERLSDKETLERLRSDLEILIKRQALKAQEMETAAKARDSYLADSEGLRKYRVYYKYAERLYHWANTQYQNREDRLLVSFNERIKKLFNAMYTGERDISVDEKYNVKVTYKGEDVAETGGLRVIKYFAYVGSLVQLAIEAKKNKSENSDNSGDEYPLVLDAAFSHADEIHTKNIARELAGVTTQLVFAVMGKDWVHAKEGVIGKICRTYELNKIDETEVKIVEV